MPYRLLAIIFFTLCFAAPARAVTCGGDFAAFLSAMAREAAAAGISRTVLDSAFAGLTPEREANEQSSQDACVANIGPEQRRQRLTFGVSILALGIGLAVVLVAIHAGPLWRLLLFVPFMSGAEGIFQAREKT